jgi:hypothetical protein
MTDHRPSSLWLRWRRIVMAFKDDPIYSMVVVMLLGAIGVIVPIWLGRLGEWPYLVLSLSLLLGAAALCLVRETIDPSPKTRQAKFLAMMTWAAGMAMWVDVLRELPGR